jgi:lycopene cyclase domain-containing protein
VRSYTVLALVGVLLAVLLDLALLRTRLLRRRSFWTAYAIVLFFQLITNGILTALPVFRYNPRAILGLRIAYAPLEDFLFGFALFTATLAVWVRLTRGGRTVPTGPTTPPASRAARPRPAAPARRPPVR